MIDPAQYGVTFSVKQCRNFELDPTKTLGWLIKEAGFRRFRLMSYWDEHEAEDGKLDFRSLDKQVDAIDKVGGVITLCLGARQPRWPENHWPRWAWKLSKIERGNRLLAYVKTVVERYKDRACIISYQLENEALLKAFGERPEVERQRLRREYALLKRLDPSRPVIMTTSTSWGIPFRKPIPDIVGFSYYHTLYRKGSYRRSNFSPALHRWRKLLIKLIHGKPVFVHELQLEPWGPANIWDMSTEEQVKSMSVAQIGTNLKLARRIKATPIDLWGGEWWYWRQVHGDASIWQAVKRHI